MNSDESTFRLLDWFFGALIGLGGIIWKLTMGRIHAAEKSNDVLFAKFDAHVAKLEEHARRSEDRHIELLNALHNGLSKKQDK
jgi:ribosome-associated translation inhibitor RaiA